MVSPLQQLANINCTQTFTDSLLNLPGNDKKFARLFKPGMSGYLVKERRASKTGSDVEPVPFNMWMIEIYYPGMAPPVMTVTARRFWFQQFSASQRATGRSLP